jgi:hypothetical protein
MPVQAAPGGNIIKRTRVRAGDLEDIAGLQMLCPILHADDGQRAEQTAGI